MLRNQSDWDPAIMAKVSHFSHNAPKQLGQLLFVGTRRFNAHDSLGSFQQFERILSRFEREFDGRSHAMRLENRCDHLHDCARVMRRAFGRTIRFGTVDQVVDGRNMPSLVTAVRPWLGLSNPCR